MSSSKYPVHRTDLQGYGRLAVDATLALTSLVEVLHHNILRAPAVFGAATERPTRGITGFVYRTIRGVTRGVGGMADALLARWAASADGAVSSPQRDALLAALNGVLGDHLAARKNPLAIRMQLRRDSKPLALARDELHGVSGKLLLLVHGLCMNDRQWRRNGHDHGSALRDDLGFTPLYVHYNSGLPVAANGRQLAAQLRALVRAWPVPIEQIAIVAHSMGGLVVRSACDHGERAGDDWCRHLRHAVFLGTPHQGAPLERAGGFVDRALDASPYTSAFARLGRLRSAGITDLRHGNVRRDATRADRRSPARRLRTVPLPRGVNCYAVAASLSRNAGAPLGHWLGDGLVPLDSALGRHRDAARRLAFAPERQWIGYGMSHMDLLDHPTVYAQLLRWLST